MNKPTWRGVRWRIPLLVLMFVIGPVGAVFTDGEITGETRNPRKKVEPTFAVPIPPSGLPVESTLPPPRVHFSPRSAEADGPALRALPGMPPFEEANLLATVSFGATEPAAGGADDLNPVAAGPGLALRSPGQQQPEPPSVPDSVGELSHGGREAGAGGARVHAESPAEAGRDSGSDAAAPAPVETVETRSAAPGTRFEVRKTGVTWLYAGGGAGIEFQDRLVSDGETVFRFLAGSRPSPSPTELRFERYDLATGNTETHIERVTIQDSPTEPTATPVQASPSSAPTTREADEAETEAAADAQSMQVRTDELIDALEDNRRGTEALRYARELRDEGDIREAIEVLRTMREHGTGPQDEATFLLAQMLEAPGPTRDLPAARGHYRIVLEEFPLSEHWEAARRRVEYLNRHYFHIR